MAVNRNRYYNTSKATKYYHHYYLTFVSLKSIETRHRNRCTMWVERTRSANTERNLHLCIPFTAIKLEINLWNYEVIVLRTSYANNTIGLIKGTGSCVQSHYAFGATEAVIC